jgi:hypothetical protein
MANCAGCGLDLAGRDSISLPLAVTLPAQAISRRPAQAIGQRGEFHRRCASIARSQRRASADECYEHDVPLDASGWCPECRARVR